MPTALWLLLLLAPALALASSRLQGEEPSEATDQNEHDGLRGRNRPLNVRSAERTKAWTGRAAAAFAITLMLVTGACGGDDEEDPTAAAELAEDRPEEQTNETTTIADPCTLLGADEVAALATSVNGQQVVASTLVGQVGEGMGGDVTCEWWFGDGEYEVVVVWVEEATADRCTFTMTGNSSPSSLTGTDEPAVHDGATACSQRNGQFIWVQVGGTAALGWDAPTTKHAFAKAINAALSRLS